MENVAETQFKIMIYRNSMMDILTKIKHILPYLYYRTYQFYEKHENEGDSDISDHMWLSVIEMTGGDTRYLLLLFLNISGFRQMMGKNCCRRQAFCIRETSCYDHEMSQCDSTANGIQSVWRCSALISLLVK